MDKHEARAIAERELEFYLAKSYDELVTKIGYPESIERQSASGEAYQIEFECFYDDPGTKNIRVTGAVSYSGWTDFFPVSSDFILSPDGSFVGE